MARSPQRTENLKPSELLLTLKIIVDSDVGLPTQGKRFELVVEPNRYLIAVKGSRDRQ